MSTPQGRFLPLCVLAIAAGATIGWLLREDPRAQPPTPAPQLAPAPAVRPTEAIVAAPMPAPKPAAPAPKRPMASFPNGTEVELLNGVQEAVKFTWPAGYAWSPVQEKFRDDRGIDWYRHADGSVSTTVMRMETVSGKEIAVPLVYTNGGPALPAHVENAGIAPPAK